MPRKYTELTFTDTVKQAQSRYGARAQAARMEELDVIDDQLGEREAEFIRARDGFYMATVGDDGWPYLQFRGGPRGFLKVLDDRTLAYADFRGNRQYISAGNLTHDDRVSLFFMDYANRRRLKIMARASIFDAEDHPELLKQVEDPNFRARIERVVVYKIAAFDWNCPQHITPRYSLEELAVLEQTTSTSL